MQVLKSSSVVSGAYSLAGASITGGSSIVVGTNIHNQHQHHHQYARPRGVSPSRKYALTSGSGSISSGSDGGSLPPLPRRRTATGPRSFSPAPAQQPSPPLSASSLEQVALAAPPAFSSSSSYDRTTLNHDHGGPFKSPVNPTFSQISLQESPPPIQANLPSGPPPTHPDRKHHGSSFLPSVPSSQRENNLETFESIYGSMSISPSLPESISDPSNFHGPTGADSPTARVFRSKSLHHPPLSQPLPPPVRRKRPESVQVLGNGEVMLGAGTRPHRPSHSSASASGSSHIRRSSLSVTSTTSSNQTAFSSHLGSEVAHGSGSTSGASGPMGSNIQRTIEALHNIHGQLQPKLEKARYKAEAGLSRRGYMRGVESVTHTTSGEKERLTSSRAGDQRDQWKDGYLEDSGAPEVDEDFNDEGVYRSDGGEDWRYRGRMDRPTKGSGPTSSDLFGRTSEHQPSQESVEYSASNAILEKDNLKWPAGEGWKPL